jgi:spectinomycin phosphotransferase
VRSAPADLTPDRLTAALAEGWRLRPGSIEYVPEGGGSYHWKLLDEDGQPHFVTVDDLDDKDWMGKTRQAVLDGLSAALNTAAALRCEAGLKFVVAPVVAVDGQPLRRVDGRYTVSVFPFLAGRSYQFGRYPDARLRDQALDLIAALHRSTAAVQGRAPRHVLSFGGRDDLDAFLLEPDRPWQGGPFSEAGRHAFVTRAADLAELASGFDHLVEVTSVARADTVITHGEPHPGNLMSVDGRLVLIDWDTAAMAAPERDVSLIVTAANDDVDRYQEATGRELDPVVITLYRLRWYLDDLASAVRIFRNRHGDTADTRRCLDGLAPELGQLSTWLDRLA